MMVKDQGVNTFYNRLHYAYTESHFPEPIKIDFSYAKDNNGFSD